MTIYGRSEELVSRCVECDLAEPESLASLCGCAPGLVDGILSGDSVSFRSLDVLFSSNFDGVVRHTHFEMFHLPWGMDGTPLPRQAYSLKMPTSCSEVYERGFLQ